MLAADAALTPTYAQSTEDCKIHEVLLDITKGDIIHERDLIIHIHDRNTGESETRTLRVPQGEDQWAHALNQTYADMHEGNVPIQAEGAEGRDFYVLSPNENMRIRSSQGKETEYGGMRGVKFNSENFASKRTGKFTRTLPNVEVDYALRCVQECRTVNTASGKGRLFITDQPEQVEVIREKIIEAQKGNTYNINIINYNVNIESKPRRGLPPGASSRTEDTHNEQEDREESEGSLRIAGGYIVHGDNSDIINKRGITEELPVDAFGRGQGGYMRLVYEHNDWFVEAFGKHTQGTYRLEGNSFTVDSDETTTSGRVRVDRRLNNDIYITGLGDVEKITTTNGVVEEYPGMHVGDFNRTRSQLEAGISYGDRLRFSLLGGLASQRIKGEEDVDTASMSVMATYRTDAINGFVRAGRDITDYVEAGAQFNFNITESLQANIGGGLKYSVHDFSGKNNSGFNETTTKGYANIGLKYRLK